MKYLIRVVLVSIFIIFQARASFAEYAIAAETILVGEWGSKEGEFGYITDNDFPFSHSVKLYLSGDSIFILDGINNRIQEYTKGGKLKQIINLKTNWRKDGLPFDFAVLNNDFYILHSFYEGGAGKVINKYTANGKLDKAFGKLNKNNLDEGYIRLFASKKHNFILTNMWPNRIIAYDPSGKIVRTLYKGSASEVVYIEGLTFDGNPICYKNNNKTNENSIFIIDIDSNKIQQVVRNVSGYKLYGKDGNFYFVRTFSVKRKSSRLTVEQSPSNPVIHLIDPRNNEEHRIEVRDSIRYIKDDKEKILHLECGGECDSTMMDSDGTIYHLIATKDGVALRKYTILNK